MTPLARRPRGSRLRARPAFAAGTAGFALAAAAAALALPAGSQARSGPGGRLQVIEVEYRLLLSRGVVHAGAVGLEAIDRGGDPHDLRLRRLGTHAVIAAPQLAPGRRWDGTVRLRPGTYRLWCSLPEHARLGMRATLHVVR